MSAIHKPSLGLYLSIPFCRAKCSFCNFASGVGSSESIQRYVELLCDEIQQARAVADSLQIELAPVDTMYLGGGTPSLLSPELLTRLFAAVRDAFDFARDIEITMEAAPGQIEDRLLEKALALGVNRVSLGVQSLVDREAQAVGRSHTRESCLAEFGRLRRAGVMSLAGDLIAGLPYQTAASWHQSLEALGAAALDHLSVYMLEVDDDSRLGREVLNGGARLHAPAVAPEELVADLYEEACESLPRLGYQQYEISNFAQAGHRSRHNLKYWTRAPYLGFGLDAHSMLLHADGSAVRWANPDEMERYSGKATARTMEPVDTRSAFEEVVFLGLRLNEGLRWETLATFERAWVSDLQSKMRELCQEGLMGADATRLWLTARGRLLSSEIFGELLTGATVVS